MFKNMGGNVPGGNYLDGNYPGGWGGGGGGGSPWRKLIDGSFR